MRQLPCTGLVTQTSFAGLLGGSAHTQREGCTPASKQWLRQAARYADKILEQYSADDRAGPSQFNGQCAVQTKSPRVILRTAGSRDPRRSAEGRQDRADSRSAETRPQPQ